MKIMTFTAPWTNSKVRRYVYFFRDSSVTLKKKKYHGKLLQGVQASSDKYYKVTF